MSHRHRARLPLVTLLALALAALVGATATAQAQDAPVLLVADEAYAPNPFGAYVGEMLKTEGFLHQAHADLDDLDAALLAQHEVVVLAECLLDPAQEQLLRDHVAAGGRLVALRPDPDLADLFGLTYFGTRPQPPLPEYQYLSVDVTTAIGHGSESESFQYYGEADLYEFAGAETIAWLHEDEATPTAFPALVRHAYLSGVAAAFTYDPSRTVAYLRQGNPEWACYNPPDEGTCVDADGAQHPGIRPDDNFRRGPDLDDYWMDLGKCRIPQADEHQRLLARVIMNLTRDRLPLPRAWYLPDGEKALLVMTGDGDGIGYTAFEEVASTCEEYGGRFSIYLLGLPGADDPTPAQVADWIARGHEVGIHFDDTHEASSPTRAGLTAVYDASIPAFTSLYGVPPSQTTRHHWLLWYGWVTAAEIQAAHGVHLDTNNYHNGFHPPVQGELPQGYQTGSGLPQRFVNEAGEIVDSFQLLTEFSEHTHLDRMNLSVPEATQLVHELFDAALAGRYTAFCANFHPNRWGMSEPWARNMMQAAVDRGMPIVTAQTLYEFTAARDGLAFDALAWDGATLTFEVAGHRPAGDLTLMLPAEHDGFELVAVDQDGLPLALTTESVNGHEYVFFPATLDSTAGAATFTAAYQPDLEAPVLSDLQVVDVTDTAATVVWTTDEPATSQVAYGETTPPDLTTPEDPALVLDHAVGLAGLAPATTYHVEARSRDAADNLGTSTVLAFTTLASLPDCVTQTTAADFDGGAHDGTITAETDSSAAGGEVRLTPTLHDRFLDPGLDQTLWDPEAPAGYEPVIAGGVLDVADPGGADISSIVSHATFQAGTALEARLMFQPGSEYVHFGLVDASGDQDEWLLFSTQGSGGDPDPVLNASFKDADVSSQPTNVPLSTTFDAWHDFRIVWRAAPAEAEFWVDGELVATFDTSTLSRDMRIFMRKVYHHDSGFLVDWVRVTPYAPASGQFTSTVIDGGDVRDWVSLAWTGDLPDGASVLAETRSGDTPAPDADWTGWSAVSGPDITSPNARYLQYRLALATGDPLVGPAVGAVEICHADPEPDDVPPTVTDVAPPDEATGVAVATTVSATFDEHLDPATVTTTSFTVAPAGGGEPVAAMVAYDEVDLVATLTPAQPLAHATGYEARVTTAVTDLAGNPLAADHVWTFTTADAPVPVCHRSTSVADFAAGALDGTVVAETDSSEAGGELRLSLPLNDTFTDPTLDAAQWVAELPEGYEPVIENGVLDVADPGGASVSSIVSADTFGAGTVVEARLMFQPGSAHVHFGLMSTGGTQDEWILFSTQGTGDDAQPVINASVRDLDVSGDTSNIPLDVTFDAWHDFRIVRGAAEAEFWVDGELVAEHDVSGHTRPQTVFLRKAFAHPSGFLVDWARVGPHDALAGTWTSPVLGDGADISWEALAWQGDEPDGASVAFETRSGPEPTPGPAWSDWEPVIDGAIASPDAGYLQYRVALAATEPAAGPVVRDVSIMCLEVTDAPPPGHLRTALHPCAPNPFNPVTRLSFDLARPGEVSLRIYGVNGRLVATLVDGRLPSGRFQRDWYGRDDRGRRVASGIYLARLQTPEGVWVQRMALLK